MDPLTIGTIGLGVWNTLTAGKKQGEADKLNAEALRMSRQQYAERAPFRQMALNGINAANAPVNSGGIFRNASNPFARARDYSTDLGANRVPNVDVAASQQGAMDQMTGASLDDQKASLRKSGLPVGVQERMMRAMDQAEAARRQPTPQAMMQDQFLQRYGNGGQAPRSGV